MRKTIAIIYMTLFLLTGISSGLKAQTFVHPGVPFTMADLQQLKSNLTTEPWATAYAAFAADYRSNLSYTMQGPFITVGRAQDVNLTQWQNDMTAVRNLAFMWVFTGDTAYAQKATGILNAWAITNTQWTGDETFLALGDYADCYATGADILKSTYPGWTTANTTNVNNYFANILWPQADVPHPVRGANQGAIQLKIAVSIAAFLNDPVKWQQAINTYRSDAGGGLSNSLGNGEVGDAGRDEGHWAGQVEALTWSAEVAWKQGVDLFGDMGNRLLAVGELYTRFNIDTTGLYSQFIPFGGTYAYYTGFGETGGSRRQSYWYDILYNAYTTRKGIPAPYTLQFRNLAGESSTSFLYRKTTDSSSATAPAPLVHPASAAVTSLTNADIGKVGLAGSSSYNAGTWTVKGAGASVLIPPLTAKDGLNFSFQQVNGDAVIITRVTGVGNTGSGAEAGVMFRESLADSAKFVGLFLHPVPGVDLTWRGATAWSKTATSWNTPPGGYLNHYQPFAPWWLKLERVGSLISAYHSADGVNWTCLGVVEMPFAGAPYVGLCASSHNTSVLSSSTFTNLSITNPSPAGSPVITSVTADSATIGVALNYTIIASGTPTSYHAAGLPLGLSVDSSSGIISGTPTTTGTYMVTLGATNSSGTGTAILVLNVYNNVAPPAPTGLAAANAGVNQVALSWTGSVNATSYTIRRALTAGGPYTILAAGVTGTSYTDANAYPGFNYYEVTAFSGNLEGSASAAASILLPPAIPSKPTVVNGNRQVTVNWGAATGAASYNVKRAIMTGGPYTVIATGVNASSYADTALINGTFYYYVVSSVVDTLESANSPEELGVPGSTMANWSAIAVSGIWSAAANWDSAIVPVSPAILGFSSSDTAQLTNDITGLQLARVTFHPGANAFTVGGNAISAGNDITNSSINSQSLNFGITLNNILTVHADSGDVHLGGVIGGSGGLVKHGSGWLYVTGTNTWSGGTTVYDSKGGWGPNAPLAIGGNGTGTGGAATSGPLGTGNIVLKGGALLNSAATLLYNNIVVQDSMTSYLYNFSGGFSLAGKLLGGGTLQFDGTVTAGLHLSGDNSSFTGTFISVNRSSNERIRFDAASAGSASANWILNNGFTDGHGLAFGSGTISFGSLSGSGAFRNDGGGSPVMSIGALNTSTTFSGVISGNIAITKIGTGTLRYTGGDSYTGATTINAGAILVNGPNGTINSPVTVNAGTFGGSGRGSASITVGTGSGTGAVLAPGNDSIGTFTSTAAFTLNADATYAVELNSNDSSSDRMVVNGVTLNNAILTLTNLSAGDFPLGTALKIVDNTGTAAVAGTFKNLPELSLVTISGFDFRITYKGGTGNDIVLMDNRTAGPIISSGDSASVLIGRSFSYTITAVNLPIVFHAAGLPAGLSIDTITGIISGRPTVAGVFPVRLMANNATATDSAILTLTVLSNVVSGVLVASGDAKDIVEWNAILNLSYDVKRAASSGGPYTTIAHTTAARYVDTAVTNGSPYYYVVASVDSSGENANSPEVAAAPNAAQSGYWKFDEASGTRGIDSWGANHATLAATAKRSTGYAGQSLLLDGSANAYAYLPMGEVSTLNDFTIAAWVRMDAISTWMRVFDFGLGTNQYMFLTVQAAVVSGKSTVRYAVKNGGTELNVNYNYTFPLNTWTHLAVTQSGNTTSLYINGTLVGTNTNINIKPSALGNTTQNYFGKSQFAADPMFKGSIDEFKIYSRALSASEIGGAAKVKQNIVFNAIPGKKLGDTDFVISANASSGLPLIFGSSDTSVAQIDTSGNIHVAGAGTAVITVRQNGNQVYDSVAAAQSFIVAPFNLQVLQLDGNNGQDSTNGIRPYLKLVNSDSVAVPYSELTVRYWFTPENYAGINTWIDYAQLGSAVRMKYTGLDLPRDSAFGYVEYSFDRSAGNLSAGGNSGVIQSRYANADWSYFKQSNDYSYVNNSVYTSNSRITLYRNGQLVWGAEPVTVTPVVGLKVYSQSNNSGQNTISNYVKINNEGNMPVAYGDIAVRYWFTQEGTSPLQYWIDYAKLGGSYIRGQFQSVSPVLQGADHYLELKFDSALGRLYPLSTTGNIQYRIAQSDWSGLIQSNDYSYLPVASLSENNHMTVYYKGQLVYGTEPSGQQSDRQVVKVEAGGQTEMIATGVAVYPNPVVNSFTVRTCPIDNAAILQVVNTNGMVILTQRLINTTTMVSVEGWAAGVYYITVTNGAVRTTKKLVKE